MATTDQNFTVYAAAQQVVSAFLQAHNNTLVEAGNPLVAAIVNLNTILNGLPEYAQPNTGLVTVGASYDLTKAGGGAPYPAAKIVTLAGATPSFKMQPQCGALNSMVYVPLSGGASVKGVVDNSITKFYAAIDSNGTFISVNLAV